MNWLERARREIGGMGAGTTANTAEGHPTAATAVPNTHHVEIPSGSIGSNGSPLRARMRHAEALREAFEERAAIMEYDSGLSGDDAERAAWALVLKQRLLIKGTFTHRRTEADYTAALLDALPLEDWHAVITATVTAAKAGDAGARAWLAQYLIGKPGTTALAPLTVVVQQRSGRDPLVETLAKPHIDRVEYSSLHADDDIKEAVKAQVAAELQVLQGQKSTVPERAE